MPVVEGNDPSWRPPKKKKEPKPAPSFATPSEASGGHSTPPSTPYTGTPTPSYSGSSSGSSSYSPPSYYKPPKPSKPRTPESVTGLDDIIAQFKARQPGDLNRPDKPDQPRLDSNLGDFFAQIKATAEDASDGKLGKTPMESLMTGPMRGKGNTKETSLDRKDAGASDAFLDTLKNMNKMPKGEEIGLPERYRHQGRDKNNKLKWYWDKEVVNDTLNDYAAAGDEFNYDYYMSQVLDARYKDKENFAYSRTKQRSDRIEQVLQEATDLLYPDDEGKSNPEFLQQYMEDHPNFELDPLKFREDFGITGSMLRREMEQKLEGVSDPEKRAAIRSQYNSYSGPIPTYNKIQDNYRIHNEIVNGRIEKFMDRYKDMTGEDFEPPTSVEPEDPEAQQLLDDSADDSFKMFYLGKRGANKERARERRQIEEELGIKAPSIKQMVMMQVNAGMLDPNDEKAVDETILRLRNPAHPDARGMYASVALARNPDLSEEDALEFINRPFNKYVERVQRNAENDAMDQRIKDVEDFEDVEGLGDFFGDVWNVGTKRGLGADTVPDDISDEGKRALYKQNPDDAYADYVLKGEGNAFGKGLGWTLDKLLRFNYASAGFADSYIKGHENTKALWESGSPKDLAVGVALSAAQGGMSAYDQFFRGSDLPGVDNVEPMTFSDVLENQGVKNPVLKHGLGFTLDVALDPTTYVGVGVIGSAAKLSVRGTKGLAHEAVQGAEAMGEKYLSALYGKEIGESWRVARAAQRDVLDKRNWVSRMTNPDLSPKAQHSWRARKIISSPMDNSLPPLGPEATLKDIDDQLGELAVMENALNNDLAGDALRDHLRNFYKIQGEYSPTAGMADARVERVIGVIEGQGSRGLLHRINQQARQVADERGFTKQAFGGGEGGTKARAAQAEIDELRTRFPDGGPAFEARIEELTKAVDAGTYSRPDFERMFGDEAMEFSRGAELRPIFAKAMGIPEETFGKMFTDNELLEAAVRGPEMKRKADPEFRQKYDEGHRLYTKASKTLDSLRERGITAASDPRVQRASIALNTALRTLDNVDAAGTIHYLQALDQAGPLHAGEGGLVRSFDNPVYGNQAEGEQLQGLLRDVQEARMRNNSDLGVKQIAKERTEVLPRNSGDQPIKPVTPGSADNARAVDSLFDPLISKEARTPKTKAPIEKEKGFKVSPEAAPKGRASGEKKGTYDYEDELFDRDWTGTTVDDILREFPNDQGLELAENAIKQQLKRMRLDSGGRIKGLPGAQASRLKTAAPRQYMTDGALDASKLAKDIEVRLVGTKGYDERYQAFYNREAYNAMDNEGKAFLRNFTQTLQDRYNTKYLDLNLQAKSDITGIGVTTKAKHVFEGKGPRHAVVLGVQGKPQWLDLAKGRMKDNAKSVRSDADNTYNGELAGYAQGNQKIHQAIKESDETGVPPVVYVFSNKSMDSDANKWLRMNVDYAHTRGVRTVFIEMRNGQKPTSTYLKPTEQAAEQAPKTENVLRATGNFKRSAWAKNFPDGFTSARALQDAAMESGSVDDFYDVLLAPGFPGNLTDRSFLQADDVINAERDLVEKVSDQALPALTYKGERMPYNVRKARSKMEAKGATRAQREAAIKEWAGKVKEYVESLPPKAQTRLFHDIYNGALSAAKHDATEQVAKASASTKHMAKSATENSRLYPAGEGILGKATYDRVREEALRDSIDDLVKEINTRGSLPSTPSGTRASLRLPVSEQELAESVGRMYGSALSSSPRRTVNETARDVVREIKAEFQMKRADAELDRILASTADERKAIADTIEGLERAKVEAIKEVEVARKQALKAKKILRQDDIADALIQTTFWPGKKLNGDAARQLIEAKKLDLESPANKLLQPEVAAEAAAHRYNNIYANSFRAMLDPVTWTRPSKQLETPEAREILALMTGATPVLVKDGLKKIDDRMGGMMKENRKAAFEAYRTGNRYTGGQPEFVQGIHDEMNEILDIWNAQHPKYQFDLEGRPGSKSFVTWNDLAHWLPDEFVPDFKLLGKLKAKHGGQLKMSDLWEALGPNKSKLAYDPATFAHVMRIAAGQARDFRVAANAINRTFGVPRVLKYSRQDDALGLSTKITGIRTTRESVEVEKLAKLGWKTVEALGNSHFFHPAVVDEVNSLMRLLTQKDSRTQFGKAVDSALSGWKGLHTTYSPPYYVRNLVGETLMAWMGGVSHPKYYGRAARGIKWLKGADQDLTDLMAQLPALKGQLPVDTVRGSQHAFTLKSGLKGDFRTAWALYTEHGLKSTFTNTEIRTHGARAGTGALFSDRKAMRKMKQGFNKLHDFGEYAEDYVRFAHFLHALEHSGKGTLEAAAGYAARRVRKYHFDYSDVSTFEKVVIGRAWPFFKWTRFAAPVMLSHMFLTPGRVTAPTKFMGNLTNAINAGTLNSDDMYDATHGHLPSYNGMAPTWVRDLFAYQVGGMPDAEDSYAQYMRFATPQVDSLTQVFQPVDTGITLLNPAIKAAFELSRNQSMDPDMGGMPLMGSDFHKSYGINNLEATGIYASRQLGPFAKTAGQAYMNSQENREGESYGDYREENGYMPWMQLMSNLSGASAYQVHKNQMVNPNDEVVSDPTDPPVGRNDLQKFLGEAVRPNKDGNGNSNEQKTEQGIAAYDGADGSSQSGWKDFWNNFSGYSGYGGYSGGGFGGYGGGGYSSGGSTSVSRSEWGDSLMQLLASLKAQIDQGDVTT